MKNQSIDQRIVEFIVKHHLLTLATTGGETPWVASCFYAWMPKEQGLIVTTDPETRHGQEALKNKMVAGTIAWETKIIGKIQGIQFVATIEPCDEPIKTTAEQTYLKRFPIARLMETHLWIIRPVYIKMTHNLLGFGTKLVWEKAAAP